ncbi:hypothetical protein JHC27_03230, partial [archaeon]|nr:hypothetical protein [archaeon]
MVADKRTIVKNFWEWRRKLGNIMQPFEAFLVL